VVTIVAAPHSICSSRLARLNTDRYGANIGHNVYVCIEGIHGVTHTGSQSVSEQGSAAIDRLGKWNQGGRLGTIIQDLPRIDKTIDLQHLKYLYFQFRHEYINLSRFCSFFWRLYVYVFVHFYVNTRCVFVAIFFHMCLHSNWFFLFYQNHSAHYKHTCMHTVTRAHTISVRNMKWQEPSAMATAC